MGRGSRALSMQYAGARLPAPATDPAASSTTRAVRRRILIGASPVMRRPRERNVDHRRTYDGRRRSALWNEPGTRFAALLLLALTGCGPDCELGFDAGEQFRITVQRLEADRPEGCGVLKLEPGSSFVLTAGEKWLDSEGVCYERGAVPVVPPPFESILAECEPWPGQLAAHCSGQITSDCAGDAYFGVRPAIRQNDRVIEAGTFTVGWTGNTCYPVGCTDLYAVRVERLGKLEL
jgi:hypothetical protein